MRFPTKDQEALNAYLDDLLPPAERKHLEERLQHDTRLQQELEALRRTRAVLRAAPRVRAPRNFTLTPALLTPQPSFLDWLRPTLQWSSALAALLFLLVFIGQGLWHPASQSRMAEQPEMSLQSTKQQVASQQTPQTDVLPFGLAPLQVITGTKQATSPYPEAAPTPLPQATLPTAPAPPPFPWRALKIGLAATALLCFLLARVLGRRR